MELELIPFTTIFTIFFIIIIFIIFKSKSKNSNSKIPPGPRKLPFIGNIHQLGSLPHQSLSKLASQYGPLMHIKLGELSCIVISSPEMAKQVMKTHDLIFANRPPLLASQVIAYGSKSMISSPYGDFYRQMRKIYTMELLAPKRVESFRSIREDELLNFVKEMKEKSELGLIVNLSEKIRSLIYGLTSRAIFGGKSKDHRDAYSEMMKDVIKVASGFSLADMFPSICVLQGLTGFRAKLEKLHRGMDRILEDIVRDHKEKRLMDRNGVCEEEDFVDVLLKLQRQPDLELPLTNSMIKATILDLFSAGSDTTSTTIDWAMAELVRNPLIMEKAQAEVRKVYNTKGHVDESSIDELRYLKCVIKETLRLHPPGPLLLPRECSERCEINGFEIASKSKVFVNAWAIGRDPKYWIEAERFYPERFLDSSVSYKGVDFELIPFGAGRRMCPGITFGVAVVELSLANLLFHFDWEVPHGNDPQELDMTESFGLGVRRKQNLMLIPINKC